MSICKPDNTMYMSICKPSVESPRSICKLNDCGVAGQAPLTKIDIANVIRAQNGTSTLYKPGEMAQAILTAS